MGSLWNLRGGKTSATSDIEGASRQNNESSSSPTSKRRWATFLPLLVILAVIAEIGFLGRLSMTKTASSLHFSGTDSFFYTNHSTIVSRADSLLGNETWNIPFPKRPHAFKPGEELRVGLRRDKRHDRTTDSVNCEVWLEREDSVIYSRDFQKEPILIRGGTQEFKTCAVECQFQDSNGREYDAGFGYPQNGRTASVLRSMESSHYYSDNDISMARRKGIQIVMTTSLSSDVPVGYFSWAEYDIMAPVEPKTEKALAAAFISNCGAHNFRLQALDALEKLKISIDSYGGCHRNRDGRVDKVKTLKRYKFSLAFENSNEEDYVTEKFFQSLVAGTIPVVIGAPNSQDFSPGPGAILHLKELKDIEKVAKRMRYLAGNPVAYNRSLRWKYEGPSDSFKALVDMAAVHSTCRLCIHLATKIQEEDEKTPRFKKRPCKCNNGKSTVHHLYVRERGRFKMESIFLRSENLTLKALENEVLRKFVALNHVPIWKDERPPSIRGSDKLRVHRIYPIGMTQRQALYTFKFNGDDEFQKHLEANPCSKFEVIFV